MNDGMVKPVAKDWKLVEYYLNEIMKSNQKQLDGMYNLPGESTFWVPKRAGDYGNNGGNNPLNTPPTTPTTSALTGASAESLDLMDFYRKNFEQSQSASKIVSPLVSPHHATLPLTLTPPPHTYPQQGPNPAPPPFQDNHNSSIGPWTPGWKDAGGKEPYDHYNSSIGPWTPPPPVDVLGIINTFLQTIIRGFTPGLNGVPGAGLPDTRVGAGYSNDVGVGQQIPDVKTSLNMNINSSFTVMLDKQVLARAVKQILTQDLLKYGNSSTSLTRTVVV